jgi:hypothetical protein
MFKTNFGTKFEVRNLNGREQGAAAGSKSNCPVEGGGHGDDREERLGEHLPLLHSRIVRLKPDLRGTDDQSGNRVFAFKEKIAQSYISLRCSRID